MRITVERYVLLVSTGAVLATAIAGSLGVASAVVDTTAIAVFSVLALAMVVFSYVNGRSVSGSLANVSFSAMILIAPGLLTCVAIGAVSALWQIASKRTPLQKIFNVSQVVLASATASAVYSLLGGEALTRAGGNLLPAVTASLAYILTNTALVVGVLAISENKDFGTLWHKYVSALPNELLAAPVPYFAALVYLKFGVWWSAGLMLPLLGLRQVMLTQVELARTSEELLELMVKAIEARDPYVSGHSVRVAMYSRAIAQSMKLSPTFVARVEKAALLHDVGKIHEIYAPILQKTESLSAEEWELMKTHSIKSAELVGTVTQLRDLVPSIRAHHENWDGSGYPDGLKGDAIPLPARIICLADTMDAMTTDRPYRLAMSAAEVEAEVLRLKSKQYDPEIADLVLAKRLIPELLGEATTEAPAKLGSWTLRLERKRTPPHDVKAG